jgi:type II secretory pathway component PulJ
VRTSQPLRGFTLVLEEFRSKRAQPLRGFTLVELMVAMALGMILIGVIAFVFMQSSRIYSETLDEIDATYIVRSSMEIIARDLKAIQMPMFPAATQDTSLDLTIEPKNNATTNAPEDVLTYGTLHHGAAPGQPEVPIVVVVELDPATAQLTRTITKRWDSVAAGWEAGFTPIVTNLAEAVEGFSVSYSWPDSASGANAWYRGTPPNYTVGPTAGALFYYRGSADISDGVMTVTTTPPEWDPNIPVPANAARTVHINDLADNASGAFPVLEVIDKNTLRLGQAVDGTAVRFLMSMHPPAIKIALTHRTPRGSRRSLERVLALKR